jgi:hypothetical protein
MASIDTRILLTDQNGVGRYLRLQTFADRLTITDESTNQVMIIALTTSVAGDNSGDQTAATVPLEETWGLAATDVAAAALELSGDIAATSGANFLLRSADPMIPNATDLSALATGILRNTAATLTTARTINGVPFNGSANITVVDATKEPVNANIQTHIAIVAANPHGTTAAQVGAVPALTPYTVRADATDLATALTLVNQLRAALIADGIAV